MKIILINGMCLAGKDTFVGLFKALAPAGKVSMISTIDPIKKIYTEQFGWSGDKSPVDRQNLFFLKQLWISTCNGPLNWVKEQVSYAHRTGVDYLFIMVREYDEMKSIKDSFPQGTTFGLRIYRNMPNGWEPPAVETIITESFEKGERQLYDYSIFNKTTSTFPYLPDLYKDAKVFKTWCDNHGE